MIETASVPVSEELQKMLRPMMVQAVWKALNVLIRAIDGDRKIRKIQMEGSKAVLPFAPKIDGSHSEGLTLLFPSIPRPKVVDSSSLNVKSIESMEEKEAQMENLKVS